LVWNGSIKNVNCFLFRVKLTIEKIVTLALTESLHKRITYLRGEKITTLADCAKKGRKSINTLLNAARRQTIPAFREKGVWKIGVYNP
jgi:ribosomal protein L17